MIGASDLEFRWEKLRDRFEEREEGFGPKKVGSLTRDLRRSSRRKIDLARRKMNILNADEDALCERVVSQLSYSFFEFCRRKSKKRLDVAIDLIILRVHRIS